MDSAYYRLNSVYSSANAQPHPRAHAVTDNVADACSDACPNTKPDVSTNAGADTIAFHAGVPTGNSGRDNGII